MRYMEKLKNMLCDELEQYSERKSLSSSDLEMIHKLTDTIKNIDKIEIYEQGTEYGASYAKRGTHYVRGHYSHDDGDNDYSERYDMRRPDVRYSKDSAKDHMMSKLGAMMEDADPKEREILKHAMRKLEEA